MRTEMVGLLSGANFRAGLYLQSLIIRKKTPIPLPAQAIPIDSQRMEDTRIGLKNWQMWFDTAKYR